jgi:hypothetical protein
MPADVLPFPFVASPDPPGFVLLPDPDAPVPPPDPDPAAVARRREVLSRTRANRPAWVIFDLPHSPALELPDFVEQYRPDHARRVLAKKGVPVPRRRDVMFGQAGFAQAVRAAAGMRWVLDEFCDRFAERLPPRPEPRAQPPTGVITIVAAVPSPPMTAAA